MLTIVFTIIIFLLAVTALGLGTLCRRSPLKGSCGGCSNCLYRSKNHD